MTRKDIMIVATLVNAAILAALFFLAVHIEEEPFEAPPELSEVLATLPKVQEAVSVKIEQQPVTLVRKPIDELDEVIKENAIIPEPIELAFAEEVEVTVKRGDSLEKIAIANQTSVKDIKKMNKLNSDQLLVGQKLRIPLSSPSNEGSPKETEEQTKLYTVQSGDNPWTIAKKFHVRFEKLLEINSLDEAKARNLRPGDKLLVPK